MIKIIIGFVLGVFTVSLYLQAITPKGQYEVDDYELCRYEGKGHKLCMELLKD